MVSTLETLVSSARPVAALIFDGTRQELRQRAESLRPIVDQYVDVSTVQDNLDGEFNPQGAELAIVMGGDGTMLRSARLMGHAQLPVVGVNLGKLGFLAALQPAELEASLPEIADGKYSLIDHLMFECRVDGVGKESLPSRLGLNETAVLAGAPFKMLDAQLYVDGDLVTTYSCDGLIISTPVGSTAYNLAAGGPILRKDLQAMVISPLSPHTLTNRPVVDSADRVYEIVVPQPNNNTSLVVDGQVVCNLEPGDRVRIERSEAVFQTIEVSGQSYYRTLREKLGWGRRPREERTDCPPQ